MSERSVFGLAERRSPVYIQQEMEYAYIMPNNFSTVLLGWTFFPLLHESLTKVRVGISEKCSYGSTIQKFYHHLTPLSASFTELLSPSKASICHFWSLTSLSFKNGTSLSVSAPPPPPPSHNCCVAAADSFGSTAGDRVKRASNDRDVRCEEGCEVAKDEDAEGLMEDMEREEEVNVRAWVISCFNFA
jgi:hypothetical protein